MAAGTSSRFAPLSYEKPKGLLRVKGEVLIERQIRQLQEAGIYDITIVVGYKSEQFHYLEDKYGVTLVYNEDYNNLVIVCPLADLFMENLNGMSENSEYDAAREEEAILEQEILQIEETLRNAML